MAQLNIFVSSTCFDLAQIRKDLCDAITTLGHNPILCENSNFPINPNNTNFDNCINIVEREADIFVLIIGNRYGWQNEDTGKSITNHEFLKAVENGIPIYTFTLQQMVYVYDVWKDNPSANFTSIVDNNKIFEFIKDVRYKSNKWNFTFENAQDIIKILKEQLSVLFKEALSYQHKIDNNKYSQLRRLVSKETFELLVNLPDSFEPKFLLRCMKEIIDSYGSLRNDYDYAIYNTANSQIVKNNEQFIEYAQLVLGKMTNTIDSLNNLFRQALPKFYGEPGVPSDIMGLYYVAKTYGRLYESFLKTSIECRSLIMEDKYKPVILALSKFSEGSLSQMESYPTEALKKIEDIEKKNVGKEKQEINLTLTITISDEAIQQYEHELEKLSWQL